jgi:putative ABC transport system permease protein
VRGREFDSRDRQDAPPTAIINQSMAKQFWGADDPVGRHLKVGTNNLEIAGVVADIKSAGLDKSVGNEVYLPFAQNAQGNITLVVRTASDPIKMSKMLIDAVHEVDADQPVDQVHTLEQIRYESMASPRLTAGLMGLFSAMALAITLAGISGVMMLAVNQRQNEIGIRMALGASVASVLALVLRQGVGMVAVGLAIGIAGALSLSRLLGALLFGVEPYDAITFVGVSLLFLAIAIGACVIPARRAIRVDPAIALRAD